MSRKRSLFAVTAIVALLLVLAGGSGFFTRDSGAAYARAESGFEYDLPVLIWRALPQVFPEYLPGPGGYLSFGFEWVRGEQLPVGLTMTDERIPRIRPAEAAPGGMPGPVGVDGKRPDLEGYRAFLIAAAKDPRFNADIIMPHVQYNTRLSARQKAEYRYLVIPRMREALLRLEER